MNGWQIFGIVLGAVCVLLLLGAIVFFVYCCFKVGADADRKPTQTKSDGKVKINVLQNEVRIIKKFLLFPRNINSCGVFNERRWFKTAYILQAHKIFGYDGDMWFDVRWSTKEEYEIFKMTGCVSITQQQIDKAWEEYCRL